MDRVDKESEPYWRDILTKILRPNLASQAPNVSIISAREVLGIFMDDIT